MALTVEKEELLARVETALRLSGWQLLWLVYDHPAKVRLINGDAAIDAWIHIWNLTPGGRPGQMPLERRIQPTGINGLFTASLATQTLILGWSVEAGVFAAFDYSYHTLAFGKSSSVQTDLPALHDAQRDGIGVFAKATGELSIAVRPDMLGFYVKQMAVLHASGRDPADLSALRQMASDPFQVDPDNLPKPRRKVLTTALRLLRDRRFGDQVLSAYNHRCAFCEVQLRLLDAAHILPVAHPDSNDQVINGVALCALHHRAYDAALITFDTGYAIQVSKPAVAQLANAGLQGGLPQFRAALRPSLLLPKVKASHPSAEMINKANVLRGWL